jgi:hypothetical protein
MWILFRLRFVRVDTRLLRWGIPSVDHTSHIGHHRAAESKADDMRGADADSTSLAEGESKSRKLQHVPQEMTPCNLRESCSYYSPVSVRLYVVL